MLLGPVKTKKQIITQVFRKGYHNGVDLRTVNFFTRMKISIVAPEPLLVLRNSLKRGTDRYGNDYLVCRPLGPGKAFCTELKFIHIHFAEHFIEDEILEEGALIGSSAVRKDYNPPRSNSVAHHLHFETHWDSKPFDPITYFDYLGIDWVFSWKLTEREAKDSRVYTI